MLSSQWHKVLHDLWGNKTRTAIVALSIAVGLFAVGTIVSARTMLATQMAQEFASINPSSGTVQTVQLFDDSFIQAMRGLKGVGEVDARRVMDVRMKVGTRPWHALRIFAVPDYEHMHVNKIWPQSGTFPPPRNEILIERAALPLIGAEVGDTILIEMPSRKQREMRIAGVVHDLAQEPAGFEDQPYGYISTDTIEWLGEPFGYNDLYVMARNHEDKAEARNVVNRVKDRAEQSGYTIPLSLTNEPGDFPLNDVVLTILLLMGILGALALGLSAFLIVNTVTALVTEQVRQIGVMKAIGARTWQILRLYLAMVMLYGLIALVVAVPLGIVGARALSRFMANLFNFNLSEATVPPLAIGLQLAIGIAVPVLASLYPFLSTLRVGAAEAMSGYGSGQIRPPNGPLDRLLSGANLWRARYVLRRPWLLSLRNTFRRKGRLVLTLITLTLAGAIFVSVFSVRSSIFRTINNMLQMYGFDAMVTLEAPRRVAMLEAEAQRVPEVTATDVWLQLPSRLVRDDKSESGIIYMFAPHPVSDLVPPPAIVEGRWLLPGDENAVVVNSNLTKDEPEVKLGQDIVLKIAGHERPLRVVGVCLGMGAPIVYANYDYIAGLTGNTGRADTLMVTLRQHDTQFAAAARIALETRLKDAGLRVTSAATLQDKRAQMDAMFNTIVYLMLVMAVLLALVGGFGLMGTMSINVLERTREIGVLRAIGAPDRGVTRVFISEGVLIGLLSWAFSLPVAWPLSKLISDATGNSLMGMPLSFAFSTAGAWLWLAIVICLSALASYLPAKNASRLTVREVLAYE